MGIEEDKIEQIIDAHAETVDALKADITKYKNDANELDTVSAELKALKEKGGENYKKKYDELKAEYQSYKDEIAEKESNAAKETAVKEYYKSKGIDGENLEIAMRGSVSEIKSIKLKNGDIEDATAIDRLIDGCFKGLVSTTDTRGANTANPPSNDGGTQKLTKKEIYKRDEHGRYILSTAERQKALAGNPELLK